MYRMDRVGRSWVFGFIGVIFLLWTPLLSWGAAEWTFMVYIGGDNNLSEAALSDLEEMRQAVSHAGLNVVIQAECSNKYSFNLPDYVPGYNTYRLLVKNKAVQVVDGSLGNLDMGNPTTLRDFVKWAATAYPAKKYALTIWDHGAGWKNPDPAIRLYRGAVEDETAGSFMSLAQIGQAVRDSGVHLQVLDFDACLMAMYEVAYEFIGLVDYLVFSEEVEPGAGNPYTAILNGLAANPAMGPRDLGALIVNKFVESYLGSRNSVTKSAVDVGQVPGLHTRLLELVQALQAELSTQRPAIANARDRAQRYTFKANIDLISFLTQLNSIGGNIAAKGNAVASHIKNNVVSAEDHYSSTHSEGGVLTSPGVDDSHGLAIFFPSVDILKEGEMAQYAALHSNGDAGSWATFVKGFLDATGGTGSGGAIEMAPGGFAFGTLWLNDFWGLSSADVDLYVVEPTGTVGSPWIGESTPNGYFSPDSSASGLPYEIYGTKNTVMKGNYLIVINYYSNGWSDSYANVFQLYMDFPSGVTTWTPIPGTYARRMDLSWPAPEIWDLSVIQGILNGFYSDWWVPSYMTRSLDDASFEEQARMLLQVKALVDARRGKNTTGNLNKLFEYYFESKEGG